MDEVARLRQTVRRCTALLIFVLGAALEAGTARPTPLAAILLVGSGLYLLVSFVVLGPGRADTTATDGE